jgi:predicted dehydrogenase
MKELLAGATSPKACIVTVNAGAIAPSHWTQDDAIGGGRLVGENCHFVDLVRHLVGHAIVGHRTRLMDTPTRDCATVTLDFADGSIGTIHYLANGSKAFPKERVEVFVAGRVLQLDNFRVLRGFGWPGFSRMRLWRQDKGERACVRTFVEAVRGGPVPVPLAELFEVSRVSIEAAKASQ